MALSRSPHGRTNIPEPTVARLPMYHRALLALSTANVLTVSSADLAADVDVNAATLRRDLSRLGSSGTRGTGYDVVHLLRRVEDVLAINEEWQVAIVGVGNLGRALVNSRGFGSGAFRVAALIDVDPRIVGSTIAGIVISDLDALERTVHAERIKLGVIATPGPTAQDVAMRLVRAGVSAILNFAPAVISVPEPVTIRHVDLGAELQVLAFYGARGPRLRREARDA